MKDLVRGTTDDLVPMRRGRGLAGMIGEGASETPAMAEESQGETATPVDKTTSNLVSEKEKSQEDKKGSNFISNGRGVKAGASQSPLPSRSVKSMRLRDDLIIAIDTLAARERRKIYEVVEEALEQYLDARR